MNQNSYHAEILEFPGCYAQGDSPANAYTNLEIAAESWIGACIDQGQQIPEPSSNLTYSGNIALRLPRSVHRQAATLAERDNTSLNTFVVSAVSSRIGTEDVYKKMFERMDQLEQRIVMQTGYMAYQFAGWIIATSIGNSNRNMAFTAQTSTFATGNTPLTITQTNTRR